MATHPEKKSDVLPLGEYVQGAEDKNPSMFMTIQ